MFQGSGNYFGFRLHHQFRRDQRQLALKNGSGTLTLAGTNLYIGTTTVNGGALLVNGVISTNA